LTKKIIFSAQEDPFEIKRMIMVEIFQ